MYAIAGKIRRMLQKAGFFEKVDIRCMYVSIHDAVLAAVGGDRKTSPEKGLLPSQVNIHVMMCMVNLECAASMCRPTTE